MRVKRNPFGAISIEPTPVVVTNAGTIYFGSKGAIDPNTSPVSLQEKQQKQAQISMLILEAAERVAQEKQVSPEVAREMLFPTIKEDEEGNPIAQPSVNLIDYLSSEQKMQYFSLTQEVADLPLKAATLMIRYRMLYSLTLTEPAKVKAKQLYIYEPWFDVSIGDKFKFGSTVVKISEPYDPESGAIGIEPLSSALEADAVGFLLTDNGKGYVMGDRQWSEEQTKELTSECSNGDVSQIEAIYRFYLKESGRLDETPDMGKLPSVNSESDLEPTLIQSQSIGDPSTGDLALVG